MRIYELEVCQDGSNKTVRHMVWTNKQLPESLLQIIGLLLDGGAHPGLEEEYLEAASYVSVKEPFAGDEICPWQYP